MGKKGEGEEGERRKSGKRRKSQEEGVEGAGEGGGTSVGVGSLPTS